MSVEEPDEPPISAGELQATMWVIADIRAELTLIRRLIEEDDGGEEETEADDS